MQGLPSQELQQRHLSTDTFIQTLALAYVTVGQLVSNGTRNFCVQQFGNGQGSRPPGNSLN